MNRAAPPVKYLSYSTRKPACIAACVLPGLPSHVEFEDLYSLYLLPSPSPSTLPPLRPPLGLPISKTLRAAPQVPVESGESAPRLQKEDRGAPQISRTKA